MDPFKKELIGKLKKFPKDDNLLSMALVGSFAEKEKFGKSEDVDIAVVFKKMSVKSFLLLKNYLEAICKSLSNNERYVYPAIVSGPIKPKSGKRQTFMLHVLLAKYETYEIRWSRPLIVDWMYHNLPLRGKKIKELVKFRRFSKEDLLEGGDGLEFVKRIITSRKMISSVYFVRNGKIVKRRWKRAVKGKDEVFEILQYAIISSLLNVARLHNPKFKKDEISLVGYSQKNLPKRYSKMVSDIYGMKKEFKETGKLDFDQKEWENKATDFINHLIDSV